MKNKRLLSIALSVLMLICSCTMAFCAFAEDGVYDTAMAKEVTTLVNDFRTSGTAWYWNADNATKTNCGTLPKFTYSTELEQYAKTRAKELSQSFSHTRPDGTICFSIFSADYLEKAENIAAGQITAKEVFDSWSETDNKYEGQGHRRNMLSTKFDSIGVACFKANGVTYWVQEFGKKKTTTTTTVTKKISTATLSTTKYTYDGKAKKPVVTVKDSKGNKIASTNYKVTYSNNTKVGKATVTIKGAGAYTGTITKTFTIVPKGTTISSLTAVSKGFTVKWSKQATQTTGYQIQIATNSGFTSGVKSYTVSSPTTVSKKITKLTGKKKYYVRIRTYKTVSSTKYYSSWSAKKYVTTKNSVSTTKTVYITPTGKKYHYDNHCNGGNYKKSTLSEAKRKNLTPCKKCVN